MYQNQLLPREWKKGEIILIPKKDKNPAKVENKRPISLLSSLGKVFERLILKEIKSHLEDNNLLPATQLGFQHRLSATAQAFALDVTARHKRAYSQ